MNERHDKRSEWQAAWAAIHHDGSVSLAASVGGHRDGPDSVAQPNTIEGSAIECAVADLMALARAAGAHFGTGEYEVRVGIEAGTDLEATGPILIRSTNNFGQPFDGTSLELRRYAPVNATMLTKADRWIEA